MEIKLKNGEVIKFEFAHYGDERPLNMTDGEEAIAEYIKSLCPVEIVRKSDDYLTAVGSGHDVVRFKYTDRAKWLLFPYIENKPVKHRFESLEDLGQFEEQIKKSYEECVYISTL